MLWFVADAKLAETTKVGDLMTRNLVTCEPEDALGNCEELMQKHQVRRLPVTDKQGRCIGMVAQADIALHGSAAKVAKTLEQISKPPKAQPAAQTARA
jgi:CBS-domain-containing membrane protein